MTEDRRLKHGLTNHPAYRSWADMKTRCYNPSCPRFPDWGGRGIKVCDPWLDFANFWKDMGSTWAKGLQLGRLDNDKDYSKDNCEWQTPFEQQQNKRDTLYVNSPEGLTPIGVVAKKYGINVMTLKYRHKMGWEPAKLVSRPDPTRQQRPAKKSTGN